MVAYGSSPPLGGWKATPELWYSKSTGKLQQKWQLYVVNIMTADGSYYGAHHPVECPTGQYEWRDVPCESHVSHTDYKYKLGPEYRSIQREMITWEGNIATPYRPGDNLICPEPSQDNGKTNSLSVYLRLEQWVRNKLSWFSGSRT